MSPTNGTYAMCTWTTLIVLAMQLLSSPSLAQTPSMTWSIDILSRYINDDNDELLRGGPVLQTNLNAEFKNGVYLNLWASKSLDTGSPVENLGNEIDYTLGWSGSAGPIGVDLNVAYWSLSDPLLFRSHGDVVQTVVELNKEFEIGDQVFTPYTRFEPTFPLDGTEAGVYMAVGIRHKAKLTEILAFKQSARIVYDPGIYGLTSGYNFRYDAALAWELSKSSTLRLPTFRAYLPVTSLGDGRTNEYILGAGYDLSF